MIAIAKKPAPKKPDPVPDDSKKRAGRAIATQSAMESDAINFMTRWQECSDYIQPRKGNIMTKMSPGQSQTVKLFDTTAEQSLLVYAAGIVSFLTPTSERWFRLEPRDKDASPEFKVWLDEASEQMAKEIGNSSFYEIWHEDNLDGGCFGSSLMRTDEYADDVEGLLGFTNIPVGTFWWREDNRGRISTITRKWKWTAQQAAQEFGEDSLTAQLQRAFSSTETQSQQREFTFIEIVQPRARKDVIQGLTAPENRKWECLYICVEDQDIVREDGYYENPYAGCRTLRSNNEVYGRGPGTQAMPEIKMINRMEEDITTTIERMAKPSWISPDDTAYEPDNRPDGVTFWDASKGAHYKPEQVELKNQVDLAEEKTNQKRQVVRDYFYCDMFKLLTSNEEMRREKTAYEVAQMVAERMILFSPIFGRITKEKLNPTIYRVFSIMFRNNRFKPLPVGMDLNMEFDVVYVSKIALAIKAIQNQALATAVQLIITMLQLDPTLVNLLKCEEAVRDVLANAAVPAKWIRTPSEYRALAKAQLDQQARLQAAQGAEATTSAIKNLGPQAQTAAAKGMSQAAARAA